MRGDAGKSSFASASMTGRSEWQRLRPQRETLESSTSTPPGSLRALKQAAAKAQESRVIALALAFNPISPNGLIREFIEYRVERSLTFGQLSARFIPPRRLLRAAS